MDVTEHFTAINTLSLTASLLRRQLITLYRCVSSSSDPELLKGFIEINGKETHFQGMKVWERKLHAGFHPRNLQWGEEISLWDPTWMLKVRDHSWFPDTELLPASANPAELWLLFSSEDTLEKLVKSPLAQYNVSSQLKSILP